MAKSTSRHCNRPSLPPRTVLDASPQQQEHAPRFLLSMPASSHYIPGPTQQLQNHELTPDPTTLHPDLPYLQNHDVVLLHEIIATASLSPTLPHLPFRSIFAAYDAVLARHGLRAQHDQVYLRFLFRLGERLGRRDSVEEGALLEEFEKLLWELGIRVEFGSSEEGSEVQVREGEGGGGYTEQSLRDGGKWGGGMQEQEDDDYDDETGGGEWMGGRRERRASFSGVFEADDESTREVRRRADSRASVSRLQDHSTGFGSTPFRTKRGAAGRRENGAGGYEREQVQAEAARNRSRMRQQVARDERFYNEHPDAQQSSRNLKPLPRTRKARNRRSLDQGRRRHVQQIPVYEDTIDREATLSDRLYPTQSSRVTSRSDRQYASQSSQRTSRSISPPFIYRPSATQLLRDADTFSHFRVRSHARALLQQWRTRAISAHATHLRLAQDAEAFDRHALLRQAFDQWRQLRVVRKHAAETERFFAHIGERVARDRDRDLLTRAFTHWVQCASEERDRGQMARRQVVRMRYWSAWREVTAVNEAKVRGFQMRRMLERWKGKAGEIESMKRVAAEVERRAAVKRWYWGWYFAFCARWATKLQEHRLREKTLSRWTVALASQKQQAATADAFRRYYLYKRTLQTWSTRHRETLAHHQTAASHHRHALAQHVLQHLRIQSRLSSPFRRTTALVAHRLASTALQTWSFHTKLRRHATHVSDQRVLRNAWTAWNDRLRIETLARAITDRLALHALYKWVLAERGVLLARLNGERLQGRVLARLVQRKRELDERLGPAERRAVQGRDRRVLATALDRWRERYRSTVRLSERAHEFLCPRVTGRVMLGWHAAAQRQAELERWGVEAAWYFRARRSLRALGRAVVESKKGRRREAYVAVRRMVKVNLARRVVAAWRERAAVVAGMESEA
ncbi:MAG: hypothetical protein LQ340_002298, partial [Diploschistes diacapsis]